MILTNSILTDSSGALVEKKVPSLMQMLKTSEPIRKFKYVEYLYTVTGYGDDKQALNVDDKSRGATYFG